MVVVLRNDKFICLCYVYDMSVTFADVENVIVVQKSLHVLTESHKFIVDLLVVPMQLVFMILLFPQVRFAC